VPLKVLDVAGGTGDISFKILNKAKLDNPHSQDLQVDITVSDIQTPKNLKCKAGKFSVI